MIENAVNPDRNSYALKGEKEKHFIKLEFSGDSVQYALPIYWIYWNDTVGLTGLDNIRFNGIAP